MREHVLDNGKSMLDKKRPTLITARPCYVVVFKSGHNSWSLTVCDSVGRQEGLRRETHGIV